jgi:hypothetical protein
MKITKILSVSILTAQTLALAGSVTYAADPALDRVCQAEGQMDMMTAQARDQGRPIQSILDGIDAALGPGYSGTVSAQARASGAQKVKERVRAIYANPDLSPTQAYNAAVKACYAAGK